MAVAEVMEGGSRIALHTEFREKEKVKQLPGVRWSTADNLWTLPLSWAACVQLRSVFGDTLQVGTNLAGWAQAELSNRINPCLALRTAPDAEELSFMTKLRPFQRAGAWFLRVSGQALCGDDMGLGKTVQAIAALEAGGSDFYPALVVCPSGMKYVWEEEFRRWAPSRLTTVIDGTAAERRKQLQQLLDGEVEVGIINYESLRKHTRLAPYGSVVLSDEEKTPKELNAVAFRTVIADEAHRVKNPRAAQTRALWAVGDVSPYRFALSGTPVANGPEDLWTLMRFVSPQEYPAKTKFMDRYADQAYNVFGFKQVIGIRNETKDELFRILDPRFIRRTKAQVLPELPPKQYAVRYVEMSAKQKKAYEAIRKESMAELESGILLATSPLAKLTRLLQFASCYGEIVSDGINPETGEDLERLVLTAPSCKVDSLLELVDELGDDQAIVFAESRQLIELAWQKLLTDGYVVSKIVGGQNAIERNGEREKFANRQAKLLLMTLGAGGEGLSFPGVTTGIFLQRSFNAILNAQAEDRIYGIGRGEEGVGSTIIDVVTHNTVESRVHAVRQEKADQLEAIARDAETLKKWLAK